MRTRRLASVVGLEWEQPDAMRCHMLVLELSDPGFDHTVLSEFRARLQGKPWTCCWRRCSGGQKRAGASARPTTH